jgi:hypothetical protein
MWWLLYEHDPSEAGSNSNSSSHIGNDAVRAIWDPAQDPTMFRFDLGYPASSRSRSYACLAPTSNSSSTRAFAAVKAVPDGAKLTLERNGVVLSCREPFSFLAGNRSSYTSPVVTVRGTSFSFGLDANDVSTTPLDGTCASTASSLSGGAIAGIVAGALVGAALLALVAVRALRRRGSRIDRHGANDQAVSAGSEKQSPPKGGPAEA